MKLNLSKDTAKKFMLYKNGLIEDYKFAGKEGVFDYIRQVSVLQYDPVDVCGKSPEILLNSRVKGFNKDMLYELLYKDRLVFDYHDKQMSILLTSEWKYFDRTRQRFFNNTSNKEGIEEFSEYITSLIREKGVLSSRDIPSDTKLDWYWGKTSAHRAALEALYLSGKLVISNKSNTIKYYDFAEKIIPEKYYFMEEPNVSDTEHFKWRIKRRIGALGLLWNRPSDAFLGISGLNAANRRLAFNELINGREIKEVYIENIKDPFYLLAEDIPMLEYVSGNGDLKPRCELLAPLDNFIWDRKLVEAIWGFKYRWEIYTPEAKREYGYYVLPVIYGTEFLGRVELKRDSKKKIMLKKNFWQEKGTKITKTTINALEKAIDKLAVMNGVKY
ncbi:MAG: winged helix DNA-binding domain-containing protein [Defluviitaleaceae bacterium]|nr:winged helix DNA-binding domain-containing protein [Defluviitaleaceae bacterium]